MADFGDFAKLAKARHCRHFWSRGLRQNVLRWLRFKCILISRSRDSRRGDFRVPEVDLLFGQFSLGPPFGKSQKMADFGDFAKLAKARHCRHFWSRDLRQNVLRWLRFKSILISRSRDSRWGDFRAPEVDLLFGQFSLGPPFGKCQKMAHFGDFANLAKARHCRHFWSRGLRQNVLRWVRFKYILISRSRDSRRGDFRAPEVDLLFGQFSLGPPFGKSQKMADFGDFAKLAKARQWRHFWSLSLRQNVFRWLRFKCILISRSRDSRRSDFWAPEVDLFFWAVFFWSPLW